MGLRRRHVRPFDQEKFLASLDRLRREHGILAVTAHVMVPLDADHHHILKADTGVDQLHIDICDIAARARVPA